MSLANTRKAASRLARLKETGPLGSDWPTVKKRVVGGHLTACNVESALRSHALPQRAESHARYFKAGPGEYGEGDQFLGVKVPQQHAVAKQFRDLPFAEVLKLLKSPWHECRTTATMILCLQYAKGDAKLRQKIFDAYLKHRKYLNNWDIIDGSVGQIVGAHLLGKDCSVLYELVKSKNWNERRIAIIATQHFIRQNKFEHTLKLAEALLDDDHDLLHKAAGWMLREVGDRDGVLLRKFLRRHTPRMPRTMLRYAIEKFPPAERKAWMEIPRVHKAP